MAGKTGATETNPPEANPPEANPPETNPPEANPPEANPPKANPPKANMSRAKTEQATPTRPRPVSNDGRMLDRHGLPLGGPARIAALAKTGKRDPHSHPEDWKPAASAPGATE